MATTPNLGITPLVEGQALPSVPHNDGIYRLDAWKGFARVVNMTRTSPPGGETNGDMYVLAGAGSGLWSGYSAGDVVLYYDGWIKWTPTAGWMVYDIDTADFYTYIGSTWTGSGIGSNFADNIFTIHDNTTPTKQARFECSGISAATTRTFTFPDRNGTFVLAGSVLRFSDTGTVEEYKPTADTDVARGTALRSAVGDMSAGDHVFIGAGSFDIGNNTLSQPGSTSISGAGAESTIIYGTNSRWLHKPTGDDFELSNLTLDQDIDFGSFGRATGLQAVDTAVTGGRFINVKTISDTDGFYYSANGSELTCINCHFKSRFDATRIEGTGSVYRFYSCKLESIGDSLASGANISIALGTSGSSTTYCYGCVIDASSTDGGMAGTLGVEGSSTRAYLYGCKISSSASAGYVQDIEGGATVHHTSYDNSKSNGVVIEFDERPILFDWTPAHGEPPASNYMLLGMLGTRRCLAADDTTDESMYFTGVMPRSYQGGSIKVFIEWCAVATTGDCVFTGAFSDIHAGIAADSDTGYATARTVTDTAGATSKYPQIAEITYTNSQADSIVANEPFRFLLTRDANNGSDDLSGDAYILRVWGVEV